MSHASADRTTDSRFARLARVCYAHPWRVVGAWVLILVVVSMAAGTLGKRDSSNFRLSGTDSQRAFDLLADRFPAQKGDSDQIVFALRGSGGTLRDPAPAARARATLAKVSALPHVESVGRLTPSPDGRIAVASLTYDDTVDKLEIDDLKKVVSTARDGATGDLQVEVGGQGAEFARQEGRAPRDSSACWPPSWCCSSRSARSWRRVCRSCRRSSPSARPWG